MNVRVARMLATGVILSAATWAFGLDIGDDAPAVQVDKWVKGGPVDVAGGKGKNIYVVEFWATWCGPCKASIPHLTELQKETKDQGVVMISISSGDDSEEKVTDFVKKMGDKMGFVVAYEDKDKPRTAKAYLDASKIDYIPYSFVIDKKGKLVWRGHPMQGLDAVVRAVVKGDYTTDSLKKVADDAAKVYREQIKKMTDAVDAYFELVGKDGQLEAAKPKGEELYKAIEGEAQFLNDVAWRILTDEDVKTRDLALSLKAATRANELTGGEDAAILDTYARALFDNGKIDEAITAEKKALELAKGNKGMVKELTESLKKYEDAKNKK